MDRKSFMQTIVPAAAALALHRTVAASNGIADQSLHLPPVLQEGDTVAITCPAGAVSTTELDQCIQVLKSWNLKVRLGKTVGKRWQKYGGTDEERLKDLQDLLDDGNVRAVLFGRGGYGTMRIVDRLQWQRFREQPKWLIGFSDITTLHLHVHSNLGIPTIHGCMSTAISAQQHHLATRSLREVLFGKPVAYVVPGDRHNRSGNCEGLLVGGNLAIIQACSGSGSDIATDGKILLLEDVNEYKHSIDRMLLHLKRSGKLDRLAGLVLGSFTATRAAEDTAFSESVEEMVLHKVQEFDYPVCFNFPVGHIKNNLALKLGVPYQLSISSTDVILNEKT